jgi:hypothetical protein
MPHCVGRGSERSSSGFGYCPVPGSFEDMRDLMNGFGRACCQECKVGFLGRYDPENPALSDVLAAAAAVRVRVIRESS